MKWRRICAFFLALLFGMVSTVHAADCQKTSESCVEGRGDPQHRRLPGASGLLALSIAVQLRLADHER
jgi:hypothetical protein